MLGVAEWGYCIICRGLANLLVSLHDGDRPCSCQLSLLVGSSCCLGTYSRSAFLPLLNSCLDSLVLLIVATSKFCTGRCEAILQKHPQQVCSDVLLVCQMHLYFKIPTFGSIVRPVPNPKLKTSLPDRVVHTIKNRQAIRLPSSNLGRTLVTTSHGAPYVLLVFGAYCLWGDHDS